MEKKKRKFAKSAEISVEIFFQDNIGSRKWMYGNKKLTQMFFHFLNTMLGSHLNFEKNYF